MLKVKSILRLFKKFTDSFTKFISVFIRSERSEKRLFRSQLVPLINDASESEQSVKYVLQHCIESNIYSTDSSKVRDFHINRS